MGKAYDVAVIGAGAIGSSVAYFNAKKGASVVLIDAGDIAQSTSSRSDGNVLVCDKQPGFDALFAKASQDMFEGLSKELDYDFEWKQRGSLFLTETEEEFQMASEFCESMKKCGIPMRMMDQKEVQDDEPYLAKDVYGGLETMSDGSVYPIGLTYGMALGAEKRVRCFLCIIVSEASDGMGTRLSLIHRTGRLRLKILWMPAEYGPR